MREPALTGSAAVPEPFRIDLHVHTAFSGDNEADPREVVERAIEQGLHGVAFTEHYTFAASEFAVPLQERFRRKLLILRGVEFSAAEGHCLIFGADPDPLAVSYAPILEVVRVVAAAGGVVIPSHPFRGGTGVGELVHRLPGICALEGCNGVNMHPMNLRAIEASRLLGIPYTGGSDAHLAREVGSCHTLFQDRVTHENLPALLRAGRYRGVDTRKTSRSWIPGTR